MGGVSLTWFVSSPNIILTSGFILPDSMKTCVCVCVCERVCVCVCFYELTISNDIPRRYESSIKYLRKNPHICCSQNVYISINKSLIPALVAGRAIHPSLSPRTTTHDHDLFLLQTSRHNCCLSPKELREERDASQPPRHATDPHLPQPLHSYCEKRKGINRSKCQALAYRPSLANRQALCGGRKERRG